VPPSSSQSSASSPFVAATGAPTSVSLTRCLPKRAASAVPSLFGYVQIFSSRREEGRERLY
jgi:hypothetical protein